MDRMRRYLVRGVREADVWMPVSETQHDAALLLQRLCKRLDPDPDSVIYAEAQTDPARPGEVHLIVYRVPR